MISSTVYDQVRNKVAVGFEFLGPLVVKNVDEGVPSYAVRIGEDSSEAPHATPTARPPHQAASAQPGSQRNARSKTFGILMVSAAALIVINLLSWRGVFWAAWPLLALALLWATRWVRNQNRIDRPSPTLAVAGLGIIAINLMSWHGTFWAIWPLLGLAAAAGVRWVMRN